MAEVLRTPEECFQDLPGYPFTPHYLDDLKGYQGLRVHYVDEGLREASHLFLCLHGEPTWSYLYRKMIPVFTAAGGRVIVPDFLGFGRSDKPTDEKIYTFNFHRNMLLQLIDRLDLRNITLVCQDWGGILGLTLPMERPQHISRLLIMNTVLATGDRPLSKGFLEWRSWVKDHPDTDIARLMGRACPQLSPAECAAYAAPFPDLRFKAGVRRFPVIVPDRPDAEGAEISRRAREWWKSEWRGQSFMAIGMKDPVLGPEVMQQLRNQIRGCLPPYEVAEAGHFVPEWGESVAEKALESFSS